MAKRLLIFVALCAPAFAQQTILMNDWVNCGSPCASLPVTYTLAIEASSQFTLAFEYTVTGTLASGETVTISNVAQRSHQAGVIATPVHLDFGGVITNPLIQVKELGVIAEHSISR